MKTPINYLTLAAATVNQTPLDWEGNRLRIIAAIEKAKEQGIQLLVLPELCICGYGCEDAFHSPEHTRIAIESLKKILPTTKDMVVIIGLPYRLPEGLYNVAAYCVDGRVVGFHAKHNLAGDGLHYEPRWFRPWESGRCVSVTFEGDSVPFGEVVLEIGGIRFGTEICEDSWVPNRPADRYAQVGVDIITCPTASHFGFGKYKTRQDIAAEASRSCGCAYILTNALGNESGRVIFDGQKLIFMQGRILAEGKRFTFQDSQMIHATINLDTLRAHRQRIFSLYHHGDSTVNVVSVPFDWKESTSGVPEELDVSRSVLSKEEEFTYALALSLFDYMRKSYSKGFVVSLSGGADSAACSVLATLALELAQKDLGAIEFDRKLSYLKRDESRRSIGLLHTVYQGTKNSGDVTRDAARAVAEELQSFHSEWVVDELADHCRKNVEDHLGRPLEWETDDITLQNIQSRVRAPGVWMLTNAVGALLLATSNRSEAAVGYATMDGDTAGSISPIGGIDKQFLRHWLRWMQTTGPKETGPFPSLRFINEQQPTAELRPQDQKQTDEADLMPYDLLNRIEKLFVRDKLGPIAIFHQVKSEPTFSHIDQSDLKQYISRFFTLWSRNQWKRERYAPSFHLDDESLDPKSWCRFPILNGGYREELSKLNKES